MQPIARGERLAAALGEPYKKPRPRRWRRPCRRCELVLTWRDNGLCASCWRDWNDLAERQERQRVALERHFFYRE